MNELNQLKYTNRMVRLEKLIALRAPPWLIANECALVAGAVYDILLPITLLRDHAGPDSTVPAEIPVTHPEEGYEDMTITAPTTDSEVVGDGDNPENES
jgi:hypothetical protein